MNIYKLKYASEAAAVDDLIEKGVIATWAYTDEDETEKRAKTYSRDTVAVVWLGEVEDVEGYHVDIMTSATIKFPNAINPKTPKHTFA